jgi:hypothetical protein
MPLINTGMWVPVTGTYMPSTLRTGCRVRCSCCGGFGWLLGAARWMVLDRTPADLKPTRREFQCSACLSLSPLSPPLSLSYSLSYRCHHCTAGVCALKDGALRRTFGSMLPECWHLMPPPSTSGQKTIACTQLTRRMVHLSGILPLLTKWNRRGCFHWMVGRCMLALTMGLCTRCTRR